MRPELLWMHEADAVEIPSEQLESGSELLHSAL
jgi:hypothetical protein